MRAAAAILALTGLALATPLFAKCKPVEPALAGGYELQNVREVGSLIHLAPDGQFQYMLTYGAYDEVAEGCWQSDGKTVTLTVRRMRVNHGNTKFRKKVLSVDPKGGLVRWEDGQRVGTYVRVKRY